MFFATGSAAASLPLALHQKQEHRWKQPQRQGKQAAMTAGKRVASAGNSKTEAEAAHLKAMTTFCSEELAVGRIGCWKNWQRENAPLSQRHGLDIITHLP